MMFSMLPTPGRITLQTNYYTPTISSPLSSSPLRASPSPLSPRSNNLPSPRHVSFPQFDYNMSSPPSSPSKKTPRTTKPPSSTSSRSSSPASNSSPNLTSNSNTSTFSKRHTKPNPLLHKREEEGRETRRKLFLKRVKEGSEEKRWKARGGDEEMMRTICVMEEKRWAERQRELIGREEVGLDEGEAYLSLDEVMLEDVEGEEERALEALLGGLGEGNGGGARRMRDPEADTLYGSDEDEYDTIFMDVIEEEIRMSSQQQPHSQGEAESTVDQDMMDMS